VHADDGTSAEEVHAQGQGLMRSKSFLLGSVLSQLFVTLQLMLLLGAQFGQQWPGRQV
jgi:hypothetical protein